MNESYINRLLNEEIEFSNKLAEINKYPSNITHLLYLIIPAFIIKYGTNNKYIIEQCFKDVPITIKDVKDSVNPAYYVSIPKYSNNEIITNKKIVLKNYENISLISLLDNLVHEYNHALNSMQNEIIVNDTVNIRTGINLNKYNKKNLTFISKSDEIILEEVINTRQTEKIIDIIKDFNNYNINNIEVSNTLYSIYHTIPDNYKSKSYYVESYACQKLMGNKTFLPTFENLRFEGQIEDLNNFFDNITGKKGSLKELAKILNKTLEEQKKLSKTKFFRKMRINKIKDLTKQAIEIVNLFNQNTVYK